MKGGRPLRFLATALGGWTLARVVLLWPTIDSLPAMLKAVVPPVAAAVRAPSPSLTIAPEAKVISPPAVTVQATTAPDPIAPLPIPQEPAPPTPAAVESGIPPPLRPAPIAQGRSRLAGSAYVFARGGANGTLTGGQLGASQLGLRLTYALGHARRIAIAARYAAPLSGKGREAGIGLDWQPTRLPLHLVAEQRFSLDGGRGGPTVEMIGGYGPALVARGVRLEAYAQAGAIGRDGVEGFVDAAARVTHRLPLGTLKLDLGLGAWGSAQRGAARFDLGPSAGLAVPVAGKAIRLTLDWRERVAGSARPGSGPALTIGSDF